MKALLLTNEYPPHVYGGAGVHVEYLARALAALMDDDFVQQTRADLAFGLKQLEDAVRGLFRCNIDVRDAAPEQRIANAAADEACPASAVNT